MNPFFYQTIWSEFFFARWAMCFEMEAVCAKVRLLKKKCQNQMVELRLSNPTSWSTVKHFIYYIWTEHCPAHVFFLVPCRRPFYKMLLWIFFLKLNLFFESTFLMLCYNIAQLDGSKRKSFDYRNKDLNDCFGESKFSPNARITS